MPRSSKWIAAGVLLLVGVTVVAFLIPSPETFQVPAGGPNPMLGAFVAAEWHGQAAPAPDQLLKTSLGVYVSLRKQGTLRAEVWERYGETAAAGLKAALVKLHQADSDGDADTVIGCIARDFQDVNANTVGTQVHRGVRGLELRAGNIVERVPPTTMLAKNLGFDSALSEFLTAHRDVRKDDVALRMFDCDQFWVPLGTPEKARTLLRGNDLVRMPEVTRDSVTRFFTLMGDWMLANLGNDGRMLYKWWPSKAEESKGNNQIRQWMATIALLRIAALRNDPALLARATDNLKYNLSQVYREEKGLGLISEEGVVKLGAVALAALAIHSHPEAAQFAQQERTLIATTAHLQEASGAFQTFYTPRDPRRSFENFYTGETLLLWAVLYRDQPDPAMLERFMRSFRYYRDWHRDNRNPAFVPWHTQADYIMWQKTKDPELVSFIFEMNDWLLGVQDWDNAAYVDMQGQFYDADRPQFGQPHASSTGVYLEGLADAHALAMELGDSKRAEAYRTGILRALRASMQLQFVDDVDLYYVPADQRARSLGGLRSRVYDNEIRVDNVQHTLLAVDKILRSKTLLP